MEHTFKKNWHAKPWKTLWTCHTFCLGPFLKELGLKSIEQKQVLNEGVMACIFSINMESTFLVALARRASNKSVKIWQNVGQLTFPLNSSLQKFDESFR